MAVGDINIRSRSEDHGSMSMYDRCGIVCCFNVGTIGGGKVDTHAPMWKPSSEHMSSSILAMHMKAAPVVMPCIAIKWVSTVGSVNTSLWKMLALGLL